MAMVRFNPDAYRDAEGRRVPSPWKPDHKSGILRVPKKDELAWKERLRVLQKHVAMALASKPPGDAKLQRITLFFDGCLSDGTQNPSSGRNVLPFQLFANFSP